MIRHPSLARILYASFITSLGFVRKHNVYIRNTVLNTPFLNGVFDASANIQFRPLLLANFRHLADISRQ